MPKTVKEIMTKRVATVGPDTRLESIARAFEKHPFHHLPVVGSDGKVTGIISAVSPRTPMMPEWRS